MVGVQAPGQTQSVHTLSHDAVQVQQAHPS